jgi:biotin transport system substrate-specific component
MKLRQLLFAALFAALMDVSAYLKIPIPTLPITLQVMIVFMSGLILTPRYAVASQLVYIALGLIGLPVFSNGGGIGYVFQPSFGFIIGFVICAFLVSLLVRSNMVALIKGNTDKPKYTYVLKIIGFTLVAIIALYVCGITYMYFMLNTYLQKGVALWYLIANYTGFYVLVDIAKFAITFPLCIAVLRRLPENFVQR